MEQKKRGLGHQGFSLVELIIVIAIIGILSGAASIGINYLVYANDKKAIISIDSTISEVRMGDMSKSLNDKPYLYLASDGTDIYMQVSTQPAITTYVASADWEKVLGSGNKLYYKVQGDTTNYELGNIALGGRSVIRISFSKVRGSFQPDDSDGSSSLTYDSIWVVKGTTTGSSIKFVAPTGKHFVSAV